MKRGIFISLEGSEGCGKSTQIRCLSARFQELGFPVLVTREPGGTEIGEIIRHLLKHAPEGRSMTSETELLLFAASRAQLAREAVEPALKKGHVVIADRFLDSTTVYQGTARKIPADAVEFINRFAVGNCLPDITFLLDLDLETARARMQKRDAVPDRIEQQPPDFFHRVRDGYLQLAAREPSRIAVIDAAQSEQSVATEIWNILAAKFHGLFQRNSI